MKQTITLDVELKDFIMKNQKEEIVLVYKNKKWQGVLKSDFIKEQDKKIQDLKDQVESFKLDNQDMKHQIKKFENALIQYGFNLINGGER